MRFWLVVFMIALLPLRGWVGDAMAIDMAAQPHDKTPISLQASTPVSAGDLCHPDGHDTAIDTTSTDHSHHHATADAASGTTEPANHPHIACDLCNVPALGLSPISTDTGAAPRALRPAAVERFASTEPRRGHKPPIA